MKRRVIFLFASVAMAGAIRAGPAALPVSDTTEVRREVDALLKLRRQLGSLPVDPPNPFLVVNEPGIGVARDPAGNAEPVAPLAGAPRLEGAAPNSATLLARYASHLHVTGLIRVKDQVNVIINDSPWKEGDMVIVEREPRLVQLQLVRIQAGQLTLRLEDAELVLRF